MAKGNKAVPFTVLSAGSWNDVFYESHSWEYSFFVPHDVRALIEGCAGARPLWRVSTRFSARGFSTWTTSGLPHTPALCYAGRPDKTAAAVVHLRQTHYNDTR